MSATPRPIRATPLWVRVDENRAKLVVFVVLFVFGSAVLLDAALVGVPGFAFGVFADDFDAYLRGYLIALGGALVFLLLAGSLAAAVQLSNAEDWVRSRFGGTELADGSRPALESAVHDMAIAAGLSAPPRILVLERTGDSINAFALGTTRSRPVIGVTQGFLDRVPEAEQRAVIAVLTARIVAGDIMFGTALAALMGPLKLIRESRKHAGGAAAGVADAGCSDPGCARGCGDGCASLPSDSDDAAGCAGIVGVVVFVIVVAVITYVAVITAAWIVTLWGRALQRTAYEKADAEGMLLLKDPAPMLSALQRAVDSSNEAADSDPSYDGIFYASTSGRPGIDRIERRRLERLRQVLGTEGGVWQAPPTNSGI